MKDFSNYKQTTDRMVEFTDKAPEHLQGRKIPMMCSKGGIRFDARLDMENLIAYEPSDPNYQEMSDLPTINELIADGIAVEWQPYKEATLDAVNEQKEFYRGGRPRIKAIKEYFKAHGFNVSTEAIMHNFNAWKCDGKSGYRDENNGCHVFSPCGCNPFSIYVTELHPDCADWQTTYIC